MIAYPMFRRFLALLLLVLSVPAAAQSVTWTIDQEHSAAMFTVRHMMVANVKGEFDGPTGIQYEENKGEVKSGPIVLQGDHDAVQFRNVWAIAL